MKRRDLERHLRAAGCEQFGEGANHSRWRHLPSGRKSAVPRHKDVPPGLVRAICKQLGVDVPPNPR